MKQRQNSFFVCIVLVQFFSLFSSHEYSQAHNNSTPHVEMNFNKHQDMGPSNSCYVSCGIREAPKNNSDMCRVNHSPVECYGTAGLKHHFATVITSAIYNAAIEDHRYAIPGYKWTQGLRGCINELSQFVHSDKTIINDLTLRLHSYCGRIENVLFDHQGEFCGIISHADQIKLIETYADFLKEFYSIQASGLFYYQSQKNEAMRQNMSVINWHWYDGKNYASDKRAIEQRYAGSVNGNLGAVHKALNAGDSAKAYAIGQQRVQTTFSGRLVGKTEKITSVFGSYPQVRKVVEQACHADKVKVEQERVAQQMAIKKDAAVVQIECEEHIDCSVRGVGVAAMSQRFDAATRTIIDTKFSKKIHNISSKDAVHINVEHLTADRKGILIEGGYLQHHLVDEAVSVVDTAVSCDLTGNMQDAVIDLANASLTSNKAGDVIMASRALDTCWAIIDFAQQAVRYACTTLSTHVPLIARGAYDGVGESLSGAVHVVCHPVETAQDVVQSFVTVAYYLGKLTYAIAEHSAACDMVEMYPERAEQILKEHSCDPSVLLAVYEQAKTVSTEDVARIGTKIAVDMMLLHGASKVISSIAKEAVPTFVSCMRKGAQSIDVAVTAEGVPVRCAEEISSLMQNVEKVGGGAVGKVVTESRMLIENMVNALLSEVRAEIIVLQEKFACVQSCIPNCAKKGFAEFANKHIKIPYEHVFGIELKWNDIKNTLSGISGFHHDFMGAVEKSGLFTFVKKGVEKNGCYMADIIVDGSYIRDKTFFPQTWSREKVISKIHEAYDDFIKSGVIPELRNDGKYLIKGSTSEGIKIQMFITKKGQMTTAYPIVKPGV